MNFSITRVRAIIQRRLYLFRRSAVRIIGLFYWSALEILVWGIITKHLMSINEPQTVFLSTLLGAVILWHFFAKIQQGITNSFLEDVWSHNLINVFASPISIGEYIAGIVSASILQAIISIVSMLLVAWILFAYNIFPYLLLLLPFIAVLILFAIAIGMMATGLILYAGPAAESIAWSLPALIVPFAAAFYPIEAMPSGMRLVAHIVPLSYVFEGMRSVIELNIFNKQDFLMGLLLALCFLGGAFGVLITSYRLVQKRGLLIKLIKE